LRPTLAARLPNGSIIVGDLGSASFVSLFTSPYPAHVGGAAIDIYFRGDEALFIFEEGRVLEVRWFDAPRLRRDAADREPLIVIELGPGVVAKILHVWPAVRVGERLRMGDCIGRLIVSGYMYPWSEKHMHLELRPVSDRYRARGAYSLALLNPVPVPSTSLVEGVVELVEKHYILLRPTKTQCYGPTPLHTPISGTRLFVEGGYPHYGYAALIAPQPVEGSPIDIGFGYAHIARANKETLQELKPFSGVATYLGREHIKLVSRTGIEGVREGDVVSLPNPLHTTQARMG